ncbi:PAS domain-containing protein [Chelativorans sp. ZYF759]|uniref:PAS domain-containing protein n=1 Tax=Chelativorans sp. ZYF759 TaxID=2692213 RepID=UPI00145EA683|nr:PAS domain-containing protein [Chelativorans sp. ZYF759]NMG41373.1 PAS domain-containing protein [Chelativorans sp. ZYF759]
MNDRRPTDGADDWRMTDRLHAQHGKGDPFAAAMRATRMSMIITDPRQPDNPIVYCNNSFLKLTGYEREEVMGRNCRFLQGPDTDSGSVDTIRSALENLSDVAIDILNYRKDGTPFWNALYISPVIDETGELQFFFASQLDVTDRKDSELQVRKEKERFEKAVQERTAELQEALHKQTVLAHEIDHRVKNNLQMIASLVIMQSRSIKDPDTRDSLKAMLARVEALSTAHRRLYQTKDTTSFDLGDFIRDLVGDLVSAFGEDGLDLRLELEPIDMAADKAAPIALIINELVTNALKHAFDDRKGGTLGISVSRPDGVLRIEVSDDGKGMNGTVDKSSFGLRLVNSLARQIQADIEWLENGPGTKVRINFTADGVYRAAGTQLAGETLGER